MPNYRRARVPGGCYFFTVVTDRRAPILCHPAARSFLGRVIRECRQRWPMFINAMVLLPDHLHTIWTLPSGDDRYAARWGWIKKEFAKHWVERGGKQQSISSSRRNQRRHGVWQPRYWEHTIEDDNDFERHFDYIHYNPVKHRFAGCPKNWQWSSFHRWVKSGVYAENWACGNVVQNQMNFADLENSVGE
ncbi:Transposase IS200 like protein [Symmachiella dynata]|uniref:REP-associated tyrosine transposase n=1 Tax=Symmachiella dynata TaxID=2527995 RepID=UPI00118B7B85|nr:transposase [Symmachiella dynata]QDT46105.1 Transposase IS200 like protein [Symmachiella dynata]